MGVLYGSELISLLRKSADAICRRLWVAVPFMGGPNTVKRILGDKWTKGNIDVKILTGACKFIKPAFETLKLFEHYGKIKVIPGLHAKIYIMDDVVLLTSANLTDTAFRKRHEFGIFLNGLETVQAVSLYEKWWDKASILIPQMIKPDKKSKAIETEDSFGFNLPVLWTLPQSPDMVKLNILSGKYKYWFKPLGSSENNYPRTAQAPTDFVTCTSKKPAGPSGIKANNLMFCFSVENEKRIVGAYVVKSAPRLMSQAEMDSKNLDKRWPWSIEVENLNEKFSIDWWNKEVTLNKLVKEFKNINDDPITENGRYDLKAANQQAPYFKVREDFAKFVLDKIK